MPGGFRVLLFHDMCILWTAVHVTACILHNAFLLGPVCKLMDWSMQFHLAC